MRPAMRLTIPAMLRDQLRDRKSNLRACEAEQSAYTAAP